MENVQNPVRSGTDESKWEEAKAAGYKLAKVSPLVGGIDGMSGVDVLQAVRGTDPNTGLPKWRFWVANGSLMFERSGSGAIHRLVATEKNRQLLDHMLRYKQVAVVGEPWPEEPKAAVASEKPAVVEGVKVTNIGQTYAEDAPVVPVTTTLNSPVVTITTNANTAAVKADPPVVPPRYPAPSGGEGNQVSRASKNAAALEKARAARKANIAARASSIVTMAE